MKQYLIILKKELVNYFRDKRSIMMMLIPLLIFPLLLYATNIQTKNAEESVADNIIISTNSQNEIADLISILNQSGIAVEINTSNAPYDELKSGNISIIINKDNSGYNIIYNQGSIKSTLAMGVVTKYLDLQKEAYIYTIFNQHGENIEDLNEFSYQYQDVSAIDESDSNSFLATLAPMLLIMFIATGCSSVAVDLFCGEKERGSLESLLATQVNRKSLYFAKVSTVLIFSCFSTVISTLGYVISFSFDNSMFENTNLKMSFEQIITLFFILISFALFASATMSFLSVEAKTMKEGTLRTSLFSVIPTMISMVTIYMETGNISIGINFIPFINTILSLKSVFMNVISPTNILVTVGSMLTYSAVLLFAGYKILNSEKILAQ